METSEHFSFIVKTIKDLDNLKLVQREVYPCKILRSCVYPILA